MAPAVLAGLSTITEEGAFSSDQRLQINSNFSSVANNFANVPGIVATVSASLGFAVFNSAVAVNLLPTTLPTGTYRISLYMVPTTSFATSTEEVITFGWTDDYQAQTVAYTSSAQTHGTITIGSQILRAVTGAALTYTPSQTGSSATAGVMAISIVVERLI